MVVVLCCVEVGGTKWGMVRADVRCGMVNGLVKNTTLPLCDHITAELWGFFFVVVGFRIYSSLLVCGGAVTTARHSGHV